MPEWLFVILILIATLIGCVIISFFVHWVVETNVEYQKKHWEDWYERREK